MITGVFLLVLTALVSLGGLMLFHRSYYPSWGDFFMSCLNPEYRLFCKLQRIYRYGLLHGWSYADYFRDEAKVVLSGVHPSVKYHIDDKLAREEFIAYYFKETFLTFGLFKEMRSDMRTDKWRTFPYSNQVSFLEALPIELRTDQGVELVQRFVDAGWFDPKTLSITIPHSPRKQHAALAAYWICQKLSLQKYDRLFHSIWKDWPESAIRNAKSSAENSPSRDFIYGRVKLVLSNT